MKKKTKKTQVLAMVIESTFNSQRKYFQVPMKVLAFFGGIFTLCVVLFSAM